MFFKADWTGHGGLYSDGGDVVPANGACALAKSLAWAVRHQLPLQEAVLTLLPNGEAPRLHGPELRGGRKDWDACLRRVYLDLRAGGGLADALDANLRNFIPAYFVAAVREAEREGRLAEILPDFAERLNYSSRLGSLFRQRLLFPCVELLVILCVLIFCMEFIAPRFGKLCDSLLDGSSAFLPRLRMALGYLDLVVLSILPVLGVFWLIRRFAFNLGGFAERLPLLGGYYRKLSMLDFHGCVASYLAVGADIAAAAAHARDACPSPRLRRLLEPFVSAVRAGKPLAEALDLLPCSSDLERWLLHESAAGGRLGEGFDNAQRLLSQKLSGSALWHAIVLETLMLFFNAILVGTVAISMFALLRTVIYHVGAS